MDSCFDKIIDVYYYFEFLDINYLSIEKANKIADMHYLGDKNIY